MFDALGPRIQQEYMTGAVSLPSIQGLPPSFNLKPGSGVALVAIAGITGLLMWRNPEHWLEYGALGAGGVALVLYRNTQA